MNSVLFIVNSLKLTVRKRTHTSRRCRDGKHSLKHQNASLHRFVVFFRFDLSRGDEQLVYSELTPVSVSQSQQVTVAIWQVQELIAAILSKSHL